MKTEKQRIPKGSGRNKILKAATELFLEHGFEGTSPQDIYAKSGVGQGSFYYHFKSKIALLDCVLEEINLDVAQKLSNIMDETNDPWERVELYLARRLRGVKGCRLGRFIYEDTSASVEVSKHTKKYLVLIREFLQTNLQLAQDNQQITQKLTASSLTEILISQVQGAYIVARMQQNADVMQKTLSDLTILLTDK